MLNTHRREFDQPRLEYSGPGLYEDWLKTGVLNGIDRILGMRVVSTDLHATHPWPLTHQFAYASRLLVPLPRIHRHIFLVPCRPIRTTRLRDQWYWEYSRPGLQGDALNGEVLAGCKKESGKHEHTTYHTRPPFAYILPLEASRTSYDPPTDDHDAPTDTLSHCHNMYVQSPAVCRTPEFEPLSDRVSSIRT